MMNNHANGFLEDGITHQCPDCNGGLSNPIDAMNMEEYLHSII